MASKTYKQLLPAWGLPLLPTIYSTINALIKIESAAADLRLSDRTLSRWLSDHQIIESALDLIIKSLNQRWFDDLIRIKSAVADLMIKSVADPMIIRSSNHRITTRFRLGGDRARVGVGSRLPGDARQHHLDAAAAHREDLDLPEARPAAAQHRPRFEHRIESNLLLIRPSNRITHWFDHRVESVDDLIIESNHSLIWSSDQTTYWFDLDLMMYVNIHLGPQAWFESILPVSSAWMASTFFTVPP